MKNRVVSIVQSIVAIVSLYCFFNPTILTAGGYVLAVDGVVVARTGCLIFSLASIVKAIDSWQ